jgi:hypothetical protein
MTDLPLMCCGLETTAATKRDECDGSSACRGKRQQA